MMTFLKSTTTALTLLLISLHSLGQTSTEFDYSKHSFSESDVLKVLQDSIYLGLNYQEITSLSTKEAIAFYKQNGYSMSQFIVAQSKARTDRKKIEVAFLDREAKIIYDDIDRKLGITR